MACFAMGRRLEDVAYRTDLSGSVFLIADGLTLAAAMLTTCYQSIRAALIDPVKSLRYE